MIFQLNLSETELVISYILGFTLLFLLLAVQFYLWKSKAFKRSDWTRWVLSLLFYLFGLIINSLTFTVSMPTSPYLQILLILAETIIFVDVSLEYFRG